MRILGSEIFVLDLLTIMTAYLFLLYGQANACVFALGQGFFIDLFSGGMPGLFTLLSLCVFGGIRFWSRIFDLQTPKGQIFIVFLVMLLKGVLFIIIAAFFQMGFSLRSFLSASWAEVVGTGLFTPVFFFIFDHLKATVFERVGRESSEGQ